MDMQPHTSNERFTPRHHDVGMVEKLLLLANRFDHRQTQLVARISDPAGGNRWIDSSITSVGLLDSGDLLLSLSIGTDADVFTERLDLLSLSASVCQPDLKNHRRRLLGSYDGGKSLFVCRDIDVVGWNNSTVYLTFVATAATEPPQQARVSH